MLEQDIRDIREKLQMWRRHYPSESAVSQSIVLRLLFTLGWPVYDTQIVYPEYTLEGRRVDFALCHPANEPRIFIEAKGVGKGTGAERQLFEYAFHQGVPLAVLTDGREWSFFLPAGEGSYDKRRVCKLDLSASDVAESVRRFERYLRYDAVRSGAALPNARNDYQDVVRKRRDQGREHQINEALPKAWAKLVAEEDAFLIEVVADCVEGLCGHKPDSNIVARFLQEMMHQPSVGPRPPLPIRSTVSPAPRNRRGRGFADFFGEERAQRFWDKLANLGIAAGENGAVINLVEFHGDLSSFAMSLVNALEVLLDGDDITRNAYRTDEFSEEQRRRFLNSPHREVHEALFHLSQRFPYVWIKGDNDYGVRTAHRNHRSGVSLVRSRGPDNLMTGQRR